MIILVNDDVWIPLSLLLLLLLRRWQSLEGEKPRKMQSH